MPGSCQRERSQAAALPMHHSELLPFPPPRLLPGMPHGKLQSRRREVPNSPVYSFS